MTTMKKEILRLGAAVAAVVVAVTLSTGPASLHAAQSYSCKSDPGHLCVNTTGGNDEYKTGFSCDNDCGGCQSCHSGGGRCAPFGSGADVEGYWP